MKKNALFKDFFREIRLSLNRFLSIMLIVALGVAFYTGVKSSQPDMHASADALFDEINLMDIRVMSGLGITEDDLAALSAIEGVTAVRGGWTAHALNEQNGKQAVAVIHSLDGDMNRVTLTEGRLPEKADECFMDSNWLHAAGFSVGDTITLKSGKDDADITDTLSTDTFTIVVRAAIRGTSLLSAAPRMWAAATSVSSCACRRKPSAWRSTPQPT